MDKKSVKRKVYWGLFLLFIIGSIAAGGPFQLIDIIVVRPIVNILFVIFNLVHDFGLAIIIFTVIVKLCMLPLAKRQLNQMKLIRKIQPMLTEIKKNCKGNKQLESMQTMDLYRRYNVKPFSSIITLIIQLPIFIALFAAINVIATPRVNDNLSNRVYPIVAYPGSEIKDLEEKQQAYLEGIKNQVENQNNGGEEQKEEVEYDFHPKLFGQVNLNVRAFDLISGKFSVSALVVLGFAILSAVLQFLVTRQQMPSGKSDKSKKFRDLINEAKEGKELDETDISNLTTKQMSTMMPMMMFILMLNFNGAIVFYYMLTNLLSLIQQKVILAKVNEEIDEVTDKAVLKQLNKIQEAEVIENKKTGTKIRRVSARDEKRSVKAEKAKSTATTGSRKGGNGASKRKGK